MKRKCLGKRQRKGYREIWSGKYDRERQSEIEKDAQRQRQRDRVTERAKKCDRNRGKARDRVENVWERDRKKNMIEKDRVRQRRMQSLR